MLSPKLLLFPTLAAAHFTLNAPTSAGTFDEDTESTGPCGGITVDFSSDTVTDFHVGGEPIAMLMTHPSANWLFRATLDEAASSNWTQLYPIVAQTGAGKYCQSAVAAPESWVGQQGVLGVVADAPDGLLYQCAAVNFVSGSGTVTSTCTNASTVIAAFGSDTSLTALVTVDDSTTNGTTSASSTSSGSASSASSTDSSSVAPLLAPSLSGLAASLAAVTLAGLMGAGLVI